MRNEQILVFPRAIFNDVFSLEMWDTIQDEIDEIERTFVWLNRRCAEESIDWVQAIPCAFIRDHDGNHCVIRRVRNERRDLDRRLTLIVGGHVDMPGDGESFRSAINENLLRELAEEVGVYLTESPRPVGVMVDGSSIRSSRHVAFLHELVADEVLLNAPEEFTTRSKFSGAFLSSPQLLEKVDEFDPWSRLLIEEYICSGAIVPAPRQTSFL